MLSTPFTFSQTIYGIDVSHWQGNIDWELLSEDGYTFSWVKATEGMTYTDPMFFNNISNGMATDIVMGAYHFARPDNNTAEEDATNFLNIASDYIGPGFLPPVLDLENPYSGGQVIVLTDLFTAQQLSDWVAEWMGLVEASTGISPFIYINGNFANYLNPSLNSYGLWFAQPDENLDPPTNIGSWSEWGFKQYSWWGNVSGINGDVDLNIFNGSISEFNDLIGLNTAEINHPLARNIKAYPNPVISHLTLDGQIPANARFSLNDMNGVLHPIKHRDGRIDVSKLQSGFYFLTILIPDNPTVILKISKA